MSEPTKHEELDQAMMASKHIVINGDGIERMQVEDYGFVLEYIKDDKTTWSDILLALDWVDIKDADDRKFWLVVRKMIQNHIDEQEKGGKDE